MTSVIPTSRRQQCLVMDTEEEHTLAHTANSHTETHFWMGLASKSAAKQTPSFQQHSEAQGSPSYEIFRNIQAPAPLKESTFCFRCWKQLQSFNELPLTDFSQSQGTVAQRYCLALPFLCHYFHLPLPSQACAACLLLLSQLLPISAVSMDCFLLCLSSRVVFEHPARVLWALLQYK